MPKLFGVDLAATMAKALGKGLLAGTLIVVTEGARDPVALSGGTNPTEEEHAFRGFYEDFRATQFDGTTIQRGDRKVLVLAGTLPAGVEPKGGDKVTMEGRTSRVISLTRDPAAATFVLHVRP